LAITLEKSFNTQNNRDIYFIEGKSALPIYRSLGRSGVGLKYYKAKNIWWAYPEFLTQDKISSLNAIGVDTSALSPGTPQDIPPVPPVSADDAPQTIEQEERPPITNKTDSDSGKYQGSSEEEASESLGVNPVGGMGYESIPNSKWYGFNIKKNIYSTSIEVDMDGEPIPLLIRLDRWYRKGRRKIPSYIYFVYHNNEFIDNISLKAPGNWGTYDEDEMAYNIPEKIKSIIDKKSDRHIYGSLKYKLQIDQRDPELTNFLEEWSGYYGEKANTFALNNFVLPKIILTEPGYEGEYDLILKRLGDSIYVEPYVDHPLKTSPRSLISFIIPPTILSIDELKSYANNFIEENRNKISEYYIKYLKSFPYAKEEEEKGREDMRSVVDMIGKNYDVPFFRSKLIEMGYIRPSKRVSKNDIERGFIPFNQISGGEEGLLGSRELDKIKWVLESRKIVNDAFTYGQNPSFFYSTIAYWLHRKAKNISSWTDMMLMDAIRHWVNLSKKYGYDLEFDDINNYFDKVSSNLYETLFHRESPKSRADEWSDFYGRGGRASGDPGAYSFKGNESALNNFVSLAVSLGANELEAKQNPKGTYRELVKMYHPDINPEATEENKASLVELIKHYNNLPVEITRANNWYNKTTTG
jgi:hypothetical protein